MRTLNCHPDTPSTEVDGISVSVEFQEAGKMWVRFHMDANLNALVLPLPVKPTRCDGLWQTTCFEVFIRRCGEAAYIELNFSPSGRWAAYAFSGYRSGMTDLPLPVSPILANDASESHFALEAEVILPPHWQNLPLDVALSAVVECQDASKSYWGLSHPPGTPDFHHSDCFAFVIPASDAP
jgi:hypothetical protein